MALKTKTNDEVEKQLVLSDFAGIPQSCSVFNVFCNTWPPDVHSRQLHYPGDARMLLKQLPQYVSYLVSWYKMAP